SPVFPVVSAPLIAAFGLRGAYILPAVSFVLMVPLLEAMRRVATPSTPPVVVAAVALIANPLFFYSLEFWEHAPAVALLAGCTALIWKSAGVAPTAPGRLRPDTIGLCLAAGALGAVAVLLRPEAALYLMALLIARRPA